MLPAVHNAWCYQAEGRVTHLPSRCASLRAITAVLGLGIAVFTVGCTQLQPHHTSVPGDASTAVKPNCTPDPAKQWSVASECVSLLVERTRDYDLYFTEFDDQGWAYRRSAAASDG